MTELFFYRASDELAAALRETNDQRERYIAEVIEPFQAEHPDNAPLWTKFGQEETCVGFADGHRDAPPPDGLSRAKNRDYLIPMRTKAGDVWRDAKKRLSQIPNSSAALARFGIREILSGNRLCFPNWVDLAEVDTGGNGAFVYNSAEYTTAPEELTPVKRSEFYALQEKALELRETSKEGADHE